MQRDTAPVNHGTSPPDPREAALFNQPGPLEQKDEEQVLDMAGALARCMGEPRILAMTLDAFLRDVPSRARSLAKLVAEERLEEVERTAHAIRGAAGLLGAESLARSAFETEAASRTRDLARIERSIDSLRTEVARCVRFVVALRGDLQLDRSGTGE